MTQDASVQIDLIKNLQHWMNPLQNWDPVTMI